MKIADQIHTMNKRTRKFQGIVLVQSWICFDYC